MKDDLLLVDFGAAFFKEFFQLRRVKGLIVFLIKFQPDATSRLEILRQIIEEEFPLGNFPESRHLMIIEANHERGNDIEFFTKVRQRTERVDSLDHAVNTEQAGDFPKHRQAIHVQADSGVAEELRDVKKVSCAAAQIENLFGTRHVEFKLANPFDVHSDPTIKIEIFRPVRTGICYRIPFADLLEPIGVDGFDNLPCLQREPVRAQNPKRVFPRARQASAVDQFLYFMAQLHSSHLVAKRNNFN